MFNMPQYVRLDELKEGDKFYYHDGLIYTMIECKVISPTQIDFVAKQLGSRDYLKMSISSQHESGFRVFRYRGRDKGSFNNGFKMAIEYCKQYMDNQQQITAHLDNDAVVHIKMNELYNKWKSINRV
jgi:hypothetical protein